MDAKAMNELKDILCAELEEYAKSGSVSRGDLDDLQKLTDTIKNLDKIEMLEDQGSSYDGGWEATGTYSDRGRSRNGGSYGGSYNDGSYNSGSYNGRSYAGRSRHYVRGHYSYGDTDMIADKIESMMQDGDMSQEEKSTLRRAMEIMRK